MAMYVLQCLTGRELEIKSCLTDIGIDAYVPEERLTVRRGGRWHDELRVLLPSYIFVALDLVAKDYYRIRQVSGIIRFLELSGGHSAALTPDEERFIRECCHDALPISQVKIESGRIVPLDGPLKHYADESCAIRYDRHGRRAVVKTLNTIHKDITLSFEVKLI